MAISVPKRNPKPSTREDEETTRDFPFRCLCKLLYRLPTAVLLLVLVFLWSSTTTIISGNIVHVCVSTRKLQLNNLYCLSAGTQPNIEPFPVIKNFTLAGNAIKEVAESVPESRPVSIFRPSDHSTRDEEIANAARSIEEQLELHRSWISHSKGRSCVGRGMFVYDLPPKFNKDLMARCSDMVPWMDLCKHMVNGGLGQPMPKLGNRWYHTHQYSLEPIFHSRALNHPCRVHNADEAKLFYVPFYGGLDILRWHFKNVTNEEKDRLGSELVEWLKRQEPWTKNLGRDHVFVLGKISWDFRRYSGSLWGTRFLELDQMQNPIKLLIERQPWHPNDIGIPHPTGFHPHSDDDITSWQQKAISSHRKNLVSFAGAERQDTPENIRSVLIQQCRSSSSGNCQFLNCHSGGCDRPEEVVEMFMESEFCLQPPGDSPTRKSVFDSLVSGCIPVVFDPFTAYYQYPWHLPEDRGRYSVYVDQEEVRQGKANVVERLTKVSKQEKDDMRSYIVYELLPGLVYGDSDSRFDKFKDAFGIAMDNLLERVTSL